MRTKDYFEHARVYWLLDEWDTEIPIVYHGVETTGIWVTLDWEANDESTAKREAKRRVAQGQKMRIIRVEESQKVVEVLGAVPQPYHADDYLVVRQNQGGTV